MSDVDARMLSALELLHYSARFSGQLFAFFFDRASDCDELLVDLRVLDAANIRLVLFCAADDRLLSKLELWNRTGHRFLVMEASPEELQSAAFIGQVQRALGEGSLPLVVLPALPGAEDERFEVMSGVVHCSVALGARKVFFPGPIANLQIDGRAVSCPAPAQLDRALSSSQALNLSPRLLSFLRDQQAEHRTELVLLAAKRGAIFREVFTHSGSGTLFTSEFPNIMRPARETDVRDILGIMQPYISKGIIKPVGEDELLRSIRSFTVYTVDEQIVALAALLEYEDCYELGKLCTMPRYQARGRARNLVRALQERARREGKRGLFALTVQEHVGDFFVQLGFVPCSRESLPAGWKENYDLSRASKAYWYDTASEPVENGT